jgi:ABC-type protease/lipase transport system fused ATPase/permease subunit
MYGAWVMSVRETRVRASAVVALSSRRILCWVKIFIFVSFYLHVCMYIYIYVCIYVYVYIHVHKNVYTERHLNMYMYLDD